MATPKPKRDLRRFELIERRYVASLSSAQVTALDMLFVELGYTYDTVPNSPIVLGETHATNYLRVSPYDVHYLRGIVHGFVVGARYGTCAHC
jgi:hypothetical protein